VVDLGLKTSGISLATEYFFCGAMDLRCARKMGAMAERGSSIWRSSSAGESAVLRGGRMRGLRRFQGKRTLPRLRACSVSEAGRLMTASGALRPARACLIGSGQPAVTVARGTGMKSSLEAAVV
jgi:hypothetical protein